MLLVCLVVFAAAGCATSQPEPTDVPENFFQPDTSIVIEPGDILRLQFYFHPELNQVQTVRPDGKIVLYFAQGIQAAGLSPDELQKKVVDLYSKDFVDPVVTVVYEQKVSRSVYVAGEVDAGGIKPLNVNATLGQILTTCQTRETRAAMHSVLLIRKYSPTEFRAYRLDADFQTGKERDIYLSGGDIIYVPRNTITKVGDFVQQYIRDIIPYQVNIGVGFNYELNNNN